MRLMGIENFRLVDRNKAGADVIFEKDSNEYKANFFFYLQGNSCLSIRTGRHEEGLRTYELEDYIKENRNELKKMVKPEVERVRKEQRIRVYGLKE